MKEKLDYLRSIDSGVVSDAMNLLGIGGWTNSIFPTNKDFKIVGKAFTGSFARVVSGEESGYSSYDVLDMCEPGDVLVLAGAPEGRIFGGNLAFISKNRGLEGIVLDGRTRDVTEIEEMIPLFCRGPINYSTDAMYRMTQIKVSVNCDGTTINPGDIIVGDRDGVIVIPASRLDDVIYQCKHVEEVEAKMNAALKRNAPGSELKEIIKEKRVPRK